MFGVASMGILWVWQLTVGIGLSLATIFGGGAIIIATALLVGWIAHRPVPPRPTFLPPTFRLSLISAVFAALTAVYLEGLFRAGRLAGLYEFDAWSFWVPKAQAIYFYGGLDHQFFHDLPGQSYPPLVPAVEAAAFHFMGSPDVVTLHVQFWFLLVGFVGAVVGLLCKRVPPLLLWPPLLLVLVTPHVVDHALQPQADFLLDELFALGALLVALWLSERKSWQLRAATLVLGAMLLTKREGYVLVVCLVIAALVAGWSDKRATWPSLLAVGLVAAASTIPWRALLYVRNLGRGGPEAGGTGLLANIDRAWPSLRLALSTLFDFDVWLVVIPILVVAIVLGFVGGDRRVATYVAVLLVLCVAALTWSTWAFPSLPITKAAALNPIVRFSGTVALAAMVLTPLLLIPRNEAS
jgi:hypothetical protein